jgi:hypothetical protein
MMSHHVITIFLMWSSYTYNFTRVGCLIMVLMDWCDIILPASQSLVVIGQTWIYLKDCIDRENDEISQRAPDILRQHVWALHFVLGGNTTYSFRACDYLGHHQRTKDCAVQVGPRHWELPHLRFLCDVLLVLVSAGGIRSYFFVRL